MSTSIDQSFIKDYVADVHEAFQQRGSRLLATVRRKPNVKGSTTTFQKVGKGTATTKARHGKVTPMNQDHTPVSCTLADFYAGDYVDKLDEAKTNIDERMTVANAGAWALGRKADNQILTVMDATTTVVSGHVILTRNKLLETVENLDSNDVPDDGNRWGLLTPRAWSAALTISEFANGDYVGDDLPFRNRNLVREWLGVKWMKHTGLPGVAGATAKCFAYHGSAIGYASGADITADIWWSGERAAHFVNHMMSGGACLIDVQGVIELQHDDTAAIPS
jgi:hypothetical protein